ncbi:glycoside hydrolase family 16 protein [Sutcliffiella horikoshii]|uniref:glycoside hydrolase family 16 protein n=1 Tax=Sutcliffiella horikoshii TaxID=79883 RepID=UPI003CEF94FF
MKKLFIIGVLIVIVFFTRNVIAENDEVTMATKLHSSKQVDMSKRLWNLKGLDLREDFDNEKLNNGIWEVLVREQNYNSELQFYHEDNVKVEDGILKITARNENKGSKQYTSGSIHTTDEFPILFGNIKVKAKFPNGKGLFPAIWLTPIDNSKYLPEIDIMEVIGSEPEIIYFVSHREDESGNLQSVHDSYTIENYNDYHIYELNWTEERIEWRIDGVVVFVIKDDIPVEPMKLMINLAIGGDWPGSPTDNSIFPADFIIDYIEITN